MAAFFNIRLVREKKDYKTRTVTRECDYRHLFRFDEVNVNWMANHFLGEKLETRGGALSSVQKMKTFLRYMADPGFQGGVGEDIGIDQTTVSRTVHEVRKKIQDKADIWIKFPQTVAEILVAKQKWASKFRVPTAIGVIDCTHVRISKPKEDGDEFINRKNFPSLNVQATCNAEEYFTSVTAEWPGSVHDSRILKNSDLFKMMQKTRDTLLIGDSGYGISPWLITPYKNPNTPEQSYFNKIYAADRVIIERCFGQLKRRFPILQYKVRTALKTIPSLILCCFVLHNVAKYLQDANDFPELDGDDGDHIEEPGTNSLPERRTRELGQQKRDEIAALIYLNRDN